MQQECSRSFAQVLLQNCFVKTPVLLPLDIDNMLPQAMPRTRVSWQF